MKFFSTCALLLLLLAPLLRAQEVAAGDQGASRQAPTFKVDVRLVSVFVTVTNAAGEPVNNLGKNDFKLYEDGNPESIAVFDRESELPLSIVLQVDTSLSTRKDLKLELASAREFVRGTIRPVDAVSLYQFSEVVDELTPFTHDLKQLDRGIDAVQLGGGTAMYDAVYLGSRALLDRHGRKVMVIITDGGDTVSKISYADALRAAQEAEAIVYPIIVVPVASDAGRDTGGEHALIQLARDTGGKYFYADSARGLQQAFNNIRNELRTQYLLGYYPSRKLADSDFRRIEVQVNGEGELHPRYRAGYYTTKAR